MLKERSRDGHKDSHRGLEMVTQIAKSGHTNGRKDNRRGPHVITKGITKANKSPERLSQRWSQMPKDGHDEGQKRPNDGNKDGQRWKKYVPNG